MAAVPIHPSHDLSKAPILRLDTSALTVRRIFDFREYGFSLAEPVDDPLLILPAVANDAECFLFLIPKDALAKGEYALLNLHVFVGRTEPVEVFARSLGESVRSVALTPTTMLGTDGLTYSRRIAMRDLFEGAEQVIARIGGRPELIVRDSHTYFRHGANLYYLGLLHASQDDCHFDRIRRDLVARLRLM